MRKVLVVCFMVLQAVDCFPTVHLIPHSHCDAGYRLSFQEYYDLQVHQILDSILTALNSSSSRKFVWEESSFLSYWWENDATDEQKSLMKKLVTEKRLEMIGGGWTMHDEAVNNVPTILNQMALGLKFLKDNLDVRPKYEWHIDPFGHSLMMPELYSALQYDAIVINRIPDDIKQRMRKDQGLEFIWRSSHTDSSIFTHVLDMHYSTPLILGVTTAEKAQSLAQTCHERLKSFRTEELLLPFGNDFDFMLASDKFSKMEEITDYINQHPDVFKLNMRFSTLDDYFSIVMSMNSPTFPVLSDVDFFPYIPCYPCYSEICGGIFSLVTIPCAYQTSDAYWSGFYTSKPALKLLTRDQEKATKVLDSITSLFPYLYESMNITIQESHKVLSLLTHHDAITGTAYTAAYSDYNKRLNTVIDAQRKATGKLEDFILCKGKHYWNEFHFDTSGVLADLNDTNVGVVAVFNPLMETRSDYTRIQLPKSTCVKVLSSSADVIQYQQVGSVLFVPLTVGPLEIQTVFLSKTQCPSTKPLKKLESVSNGYIQLTFDGNNHISSLRKVKTGEAIDLSLDFTELYEKRSSLLEIPDSICDGTDVYTFVPDEGSKSFTPQDKNITTVINSNGPLVWEIKQEIAAPKKDSSTCPIQMILRLFKPINKDDDFFQQFMEVQNIVGPLSDEPANSILFSVNTSLNTDSRYTTYTSGLYPMNRQYNYSRPLQGNTYPLVGRVSMKDERKGVAVVVSTKRPMAVSSSSKGTLDLLIHRRSKIINDPRSNDDSVLADPIYLGVIPTNETNETSYNAMSFSQSPLTAYATVVSSLAVWNKACTNSTFHPLKQSLPKTVKTLDMKLIVPPTKINREYKVGFRFVNIGKTVQEVNLSQLFVAEIVRIEETTPDYGIVLKSINDTTPVLKLSPYTLTSGLLTLMVKKSVHP